MNNEEMAKKSVLAMLREDKSMFDQPVTAALIKAVMLDYGLKEFLGYIPGDVIEKIVWRTDDNSLRTDVQYALDALKFMGMSDEQVEKSKSYQMKPYDEAMEAIWGFTEEQMLCIFDFEGLARKQFVIKSLQIDNIWDINKIEGYTVFTVEEAARQGIARAISPDESSLLATMYPDGELMKHTNTQYILLLEEAQESQEKTEFLSWLKNYTDSEDLEK